MSAPGWMDRPAELPTLDRLARARANARRVADGRSGRVTYLLPDGVQTAPSASGPSADLSWDDVDALARAFLLWGLERTTWAGYGERGLPPSQAAAQVYEPPGADATPVTVGVATATAVLRGRRLVAPVVVRPRARAQARGDGVVVVAELWREEPGVGPVGGEQVGERWVVDDRVVLDVTRRAAVSLHGGVPRAAPTTDPTVDPASSEVSARGVPVAWTVADLDAPRAWLEARGAGP
ncbi:MAG: hypothetical protein JNM10_18980 [Planctomycetia bacterium]|nr:hypothetical protein [Planctomycetia bacterium]